MRLISLLKKTAIENLRDWKILILTLVFGPFFVVLMHLYLGEAARSPFRVIVVNLDAGATDANGVAVALGSDLITEMTKAQTDKASPVFRVQLAEGRDAALTRLQAGAADLVVGIPTDFSRTLLEYRQGGQPKPALVETFGDPGNANYSMAATWSDMIAYQFGEAMAGRIAPLELRANPVGGSNLSAFDLYVPALLTLALIMLMFPAAASLIKEKDKGTIVRLRLSNMTILEWFTSVSLVQVVIGVLALLVAFVTALAFGYRTSGSLPAMLVVGTLASLSVIAISVLVAACLRTVFDLLTVGCFPFFILMFFSGGMFPLPPLRLFTLGDRSFNVNDVLPTTHAISSLGKILNSHAGLGDLAFELVAMLVLTVLFFAAGTWLFVRRHMRAQA